jgi:hypothetical protein
MYWAIAVFNFIVALSVVAMVPGQSPNAYSEPVTLVCATVIAAVSLVMLPVSVFLAKRDRWSKTNEDA